MRKTNGTKEMQRGNYITVGSWDWGSSSWGYGCCERLPHCAHPNAFCQPMYFFLSALQSLSQRILQKNRRAFPAPMSSFLTHFEFPFWNDSLDILCFKGKFSWNLVPTAGLEPARTINPRDFKSLVSTIPPRGPGGATITRLFAV